MQHLEGSGTPVLYIGRTVLKGQTIYSRVTSFVRCADVEEFDQIQLGFSFLVVCYK
jgi:hypothetical protein